MTYTLRDYQQAAVDAGVSFLLDPTPENGIIVCPTGGGKSLVIASIVLRLDGPCLVFQPSKEILDQNHAKFVAYGFHPSIYSASVGRKEIGQITLATIGSVVNRIELFQEFKYVIVDECHLCNSKAGTMYSDFFNGLPKWVKILGLTATPHRLTTDGFGGAMLKFLTRTRPRIFSKIVHVTQIGDLFKQGYLAKLEYRQVHGFDHRRLKHNSTGADYTDESVQTHFLEIGFDDTLVDQTKRLLLERKNVLVFTRFTSEARSLADQLRGAVVTSETPKREREEIISRFRSGKTRLVCNVGVLAIGFDFPELETIVLAAPTMSLARFYQQVGRGIRPHPGKEKCVVIDLVESVPHFGPVEELVLKEEAGLWVVCSATRQLTNLYYCGTPPQRSDEKLPTGVPRLAWGAPMEVRGQMVRMAPASGIFWGMWKKDQANLKLLGIYPQRGQNKVWSVVWKQRQPSTANV